MDAYKFYGTPLLIINSKTSNMPLFRFDTKGEFITDDMEIINRSIGHFDYIKLKLEKTGDRVKKTVVYAPITFETNNVTDKFNCKKCAFTTDDKMELMQHCRREHK